MNHQAIENEIETLKAKSEQVQDITLKMAISRDIAKLQDELKEIKAELKVLATPMQQLLPEIFEEKRAIPNSFLRGALFGIVKKGKRPTVHKAKIFSMSHYDIEFSGEYLDQNDLELWDSLIYLAKNRNADNQLRISLYELCTFLGYASDAGNNRSRVLSRLDRLKFAMVKISHQKKIFAGNLISNYFLDKDGDGKIVILFDKFVGKLFIDKDYTLISIDIRKMIGDNQLARWLYHFYESHANPIPLDIEFIKGLCRSESDTKEFRRLLRDALALIKKAHRALGREFYYEITKSGYLKVSKEVIQASQVALF